MARGETKMQRNNPLKGKYLRDPEKRKLDIWVEEVRIPEPPGTFSWDRKKRKGGQAWLKNRQNTTDAVRGTTS